MSLRAHFPRALAQAGSCLKIVHPAVFVLVNLFQDFGSGFSLGGKFAQRLVSPEFWSLVAFDMPPLSPTTFRSVPPLLLSGGAG